MKQRIYKFKNVAWTQLDLETLLGNLIEERKRLTVAQFAGLATLDMQREKRALTDRINALNQLLTISKAA